MTRVVAVVEEPNNREKSRKIANNREKIAKFAQRSRVAAERRSGGAAERSNEVYHKRYISFHFIHSKI
jgi:hypothetical protein